MRLNLFISSKEIKFLSIWFKNDTKLNIGSGLNIQTNNTYIKYISIICVYMYDDEVWHEGQNNPICESKSTNLRAGSNLGVCVCPP